MNTREYHKYLKYKILGFNFVIAKQESLKTRGSSALYYTYECIINFFQAVASTKKLMH